MHTFGKLEGSECRLDYGVQFAAALRRHPLTAHLAARVDRVDAALQAGWLERIAAQRAASATLAELRMQVDTVGRELTALSQLVQAETRVSRSVLELKLFPRGLEQAKRGGGARLLRSAQEILGVLEESQAPGAEAIRAAGRDRLARAIDGLERDLEALVRARAALREHWRAEEQLRRAHAVELTLVDADLRIIFPGDNARRRLFHPRWRRKRRRRDPAPPAPLAPRDHEGLGT